jgi:hypothetical protein
MLAARGVHNAASSCSPHDSIRCALARSLAEAGCKRVQERFSTTNSIPENEAFYRKCVDAFHLTRHR